jgi:hypothetical protein
MSILIVSNRSCYEHILGYEFDDKCYHILCPN